MGKRYCTNLILLVLVIKAYREATLTTHHHITTADTQNALEAFAAQLGASLTPQDGCLTARVVGEFSAGKTRLLRELLADDLPPALFPVSSIERQTKLQLEITHGERPELTLVRRENDYSPAQILETLAAFPERAQLDAQQYSAHQHRLRLSIPEPRLLLPDGDGYQEQQVPMRLFLIDTPGWNSGEDEIAEADAGDILSGSYNLCLVYVTDVRRLDGQTNAQRLNAFLQQLADADFFGKTNLLFIVTHCPIADQARFQQKAHQLVLQLWQELGCEADDLLLNINCVDFDLFNDEARAQFRQQFWQHLLAPLGRQADVLNNEPWVSQLRHWPTEWDIQPYIHLTKQRLEAAQQLVDKLSPNSEFIKGMNMDRLMGLNQQRMQQRLLEVWLRQVGYPSLEALQQALQPIPALPDEHPLAQWWQHYWLRGSEAALQPVRYFCQTLPQVITQVDEQLSDLAAFLQLQLEEPYLQALLNHESSFTCLVHSAQALSDAPIEKRIASLLALSLVDCYYRDECRAAANTEAQYTLQ